MSMEFEISDLIINRVIMGYLRRRKMFDTLLMMSMESSSSEIEYGPEISFLHNLVIRGSWEDVLSFVSPLQNHVSNYNQIIFYVKRQQYLEALCWQGGQESTSDNLPWRPIRHYSQLTSAEKEIQVDMELVVKILKELEGLCSRSEFNKLCNCLTYSNLKESPDFSDWTVSKGRYQCFESLEEILRDVVEPSSGNSSGYPSRGLEDLIALALEAAALSSIQRGNRSHPHRTPIHAAMGRDGIVYPDLLDGRAMTGVSIPPITVSCISVHGGSYFHHGIPIEGKHTDSSNTTASHLTTVHPNQIVDGAEETYYEGGRRVYPPTILHPHGDRQQQERQQPHHSNDRVNSIEENRSYYEGGRRLDKHPVQEDLRTSPRSASQQHPHGSYYHHHIEHDNAGAETSHFSGRDNAHVSEPKPPPVAWTVDMDASQSGSRSHSHGRVAPDTYSRLQQSTPPIPPLATKTASQQESEEARTARRKRAQWSAPADISSDNGSGETRSKLPLSARGLAKEGSKDAKDNRSQDTSRASSQPPPSSIASAKSDDDNGTVFSASSLATAGAGSISSRAPRPLSQISNGAQRDPPFPATAARREEERGVSGSGYCPMPWSAVPVGADIHVNPLCVHRDNTPLRCVAVCHPSETLDDSLADTRSRDRNGGVEANLSLAIGSNTKNMTVLTMSRPSNSCHIVTELKDVHKGSIYTCDWSRDGNILASGSNDKMIRIIRSTSEGSHAVSTTLRGHSGTIRSVKFNSREHGEACTLASGGAGDCRLRIWDVQSGACTELAAHHDHIHGISWLSPQLVLSGCEGGLLMAHDIRAASIAWSIDLSGRGVCSLHSLSDDGVGLVGHSDGGVSLLDLRERRLLSAYTLHSGDVRSVAMWNESSTGSVGKQWKGAGGVFALTTSFDGKGCVWRLSELAARGKVASNAGDIRKVVSLVGHTDKILSGVHSTLTNDIFTSGADGNVMCWSPHKS